MFLFIVARTMSVSEKKDNQDPAKCSQDQEAKDKETEM